MASGSQTGMLGAASSPAVIQGVTIQTGETIARGDQIALDYQGKAIKVGVPTELLGVSGIASVMSVKGVIETSLDKYLIIAATATTIYFIFYNKATNTIIAAPTLASVLSQLIDVRTLPNGDIAIMWSDSTNQNIIKYTAAGVVVGTAQAFSTLAALHNPLTSFIAPSPVAGEVWACYYLVTTFNFQCTHFNTSMVNQGTTTALAGVAAPSTAFSSMSAPGTTTIGFVLSNGASTTPQTVVYNASTRAIVGAAAGVPQSTTRTLAITWDATNSNFIIFATLATGVYIGKLTQAGGVLSSLYNLAQASASFSAMITSLSLFMGGFAYEYTAAGGGTITRKQCYTTNGETAYLSNTGVVVPNFSAEGPSIPYQSGGATLAYLTVTSPNSYHAYAVNQTTGKLTGLFSHQPLPAPIVRPNARQGARYDISVRAENVIGTSNYQVVIRRFDAGILYGTAKLVNGTLVDIDTQKLGGGFGDTNLMPVRAKTEVLAGDFSYYIGG